MVDDVEDNLLTTQSLVVRPGLDVLVEAPLPRLSSYWDGTRWHRRS